jgi:hypothetical protein
LVSDIPASDGKTVNLFLQCVIFGRKYNCVCATVELVPLLAVRRESTLTKDLKKYSTVQYNTSLGHLPSVYNTGSKQEGCIGWRGTRGYLLKYSRRRSIEDIAYKASD